MPLDPAPIVPRCRAEKVLDMPDRVGTFLGEMTEALKDPFGGLDLGNALDRAKINLHEAYDLRNTFRRIGQEFDGEGQAIILALRKRAKGVDGGGEKSSIEVLSDLVSSRGNCMMIGPEGPLYGSPQRSGDRIVGTTQSRFTLKEALEFFSGHEFCAGALRLRVRELAKRCRAESAHLVSDGQFSAAGATCRRRIYEGVDFRCIVFTSDRNSGGKSITNVFEDLAQETAAEFRIAPNYVRWYEHRTDETTMDGYEQNGCFQLVRFNSSSGLQNPQWYVCDPEFGDAIRSLIESEEA